MGDIFFDPLNGNFDEQPIVQPQVAPQASGTPADINQYPEEIQPQIKSVIDWAEASKQNTTGAAPIRSDYNTNMKFFDRITPPMSQEEEARRMRKATQATAWENMGKGISALAGAIVGGGKNVVPQVAPLATLDTWQKTIKGERDAYDRQKAAALAQDEQQYRYDRKLYEQNKRADDTWNRRVELAKQNNIAKIYQQHTAQMNKLRAMAEAHNYKMTEMEWKQAHPTISIRKGGSGGNDPFVEVTSPDGMTRRFSKKRDGETWLDQAEMWTTGLDHVTRTRRGEKQKGKIAGQSAQNQTANGGSTRRYGRDARIR